jgi:hypothetical protein
LIRTCEIDNVSGQEWIAPVRTVIPIAIASAASPNVDATEQRNIHFATSVRLADI